MTDHRIPFDPFRNKILEKKRSEAELAALKKLSSAYRTLFDNPQGCTREDARNVFNDLHNFCMTFDEPMTGNSWTYYNLGKVAVGRYLFLMRELGIDQEMQIKREETYKTKERKD